ncbi:carbohydrate sulfotransferase 2a isoform X1 [Silurus meridionalis]|uniref:carbohydrate sulfotransferase 2a isoform X1 n=1 Tax=Silurus meridionalis TaxID=175797 RepID=UPI001EEB68D8|nr:carbohydrate sulfotransferase 2a isoform X1 [Silurus meridionalis]KAI5103833.1 carbohydrate sulfotransferase 2 [Silurus meridionalis]
MKKKPFFPKPSWDKAFGKKPRTYCRSNTRIIANPGLVIKVLLQKKIIVFLAYFVLVALTMLNLANYKWANETQPCSLQVSNNLNSKSRLNLHLLYNSPQVRRRQLVYVLTTWRSGSSFFGELFNQNPGVFFLYEPLWHIWQKLYPGDALTLQGAERDMLSALYRCDFSIFQMYNTELGKNISTQDIFGAPFNKVICSYPLCSYYRKDIVGLVDDKVCKNCPLRSLEALEEQCLKYDTVVIKGVRVLDINVLAPLIMDPLLDLKVVHLVRDPRAMANSRIKSKHGLIRENLQVIRSRDPMMRHIPMAFHNPKGFRRDADYHAVTAMEVICEHMSKTLNTVLRRPDWLKGKYFLVRYEDLVENPIRTLKQVYGFVNLTASHDMEAFVMNMTSGRSNSALPFQVSSRNATMAASSWRTVLNLQQIRQAEDYCRHAMSVLGYVRARTMWEVRDLKKSLLTLPKV